MVENSHREAGMNRLMDSLGAHASAEINRASTSAPVVSNVYLNSNAQICCLVDEGVRCNRLAGNASCSKRIQRTMMQRKLRLTIDESARHIYICDHHKNIIQSMRSITKRKRKEEEEEVNVSGDEYPAYAMPLDYDATSGPAVDLSTLQVNTLRRYKRYFRVTTKPGMNKQQLAEVKTLDRVYQVRKFDLAQEQKQEVNKFVQEPTIDRLVIGRRGPHQPIEVQTLHKDSDVFLPTYEDASNLIFIKLSTKSENDKNTLSVQQLATLILSSNSDESVLNVLSELHKLRTEQELSLLQKERELLLERLSAWIDDELLFRENEYDQSFELLVSNIAQLKANEAKLRAVLKVCDHIFADLGATYNRLKTQVQTAIKDLSDEADSVFRQWTKRATHPPLDVHDACITFSTDTQTPSVNFQAQWATLVHECRTLRALGFNLSDQVVRNESIAAKFLLIAAELQEIVHFYTTIGDQILRSQQPMLIELARAFTSALEARGAIDWSVDENALRDWTNKLKLLCSNFTKENVRLRRLHQRAMDIVKRLFSLPLHSWNSAISELHTLADEVTKRHKNAGAWVKHIDHQIYKALEVRYLQLCLDSDNWLLGESSDFGHIIQVIWTEGDVTYDPSLLQIRQQLFTRIQRNCAQIFTIRGLYYGKEKRESAEEFFGGVFYRNASALDVLYSKADQVLNELKFMLNKLREWTTWHVVVQHWRTILNNENSNMKSNDSEKLDNETISLNDPSNPLYLPQSLEEYKNFLQKISAQTHQFALEYPTEHITLPGVKVRLNLSSFKVFVEWLHDELRKVLLQQLYKTILRQERTLRSQVKEYLARFNEPPTCIEQIQTLDSLLHGKLNQTLREVNLSWREVQEQHELLAVHDAQLAHTLVQLPLLGQEIAQLQACIESGDEVLLKYQKALAIETKPSFEKLAQEMNDFQKRCDLLVPSSRTEQQWLLDELTTKCTELEKTRTELNKQLEYFSKLPAFSVQVSNLFLPPAAPILKFRQYMLGSKLRQEFEEDMLSYAQLEWIVARNRLRPLAEKLSQWANKDEHGLLADTMQEWQKAIPLLSLCKGECFEQAHWTQLLSLLGVRQNDGKPQLDISNVTVQQLLNCKLAMEQKRDQLQQLQECALAERSVRDTLNELEIFALDARAQMQEYSGEVQVKLIANWASLMGKLADALLVSQSIKLTEEASANLRDTVASWQTKLAEFNALLSTLHMLQKRWTYLQPIYVANANELTDSQEFARASSGFVQLMNELEREEQICNWTQHVPGVQARVDSLNTALSQCQKRLNQFIADARDRFPKFFFLSDEDLLRVLSGKADLATSSLLRKLFNNSVHSLVLNENCSYIVAVRSGEGELLKLIQPVAYAQEGGAKAVENWLRLLDEQLRDSLRRITLNSLRAQLENEQVITEIPNQTLCVCRWLQFTAETESAITTKRLGALRQKINERLDKLSNANIKSGYVDEVHRIKTRCAILDLVHFERVIRLLEEKGNELACDDWAWRQQLRFYEQRGEIIVKMGIAEMLYSFEYLGAQIRLVHTQLTQRCFLTCSHALHLNLGAQLQGPAGTGKTESIKCLAQHLGRQVLVFNCDASIDLNSLQRILQGLLRCGYWGCFDEFNRLRLDVLSALSTIIEHIQTARNSREKPPMVSIRTTNEIEERRIEIDLKCALFITLNPLGKRYKGRVRLPDSLRALFLPCAMEAADIQSIAMVTLVSEGFPLKEANEGAEKIETCFSQAAQLLSSQTHYDWGLRSIKSCLLQAGRLLRKSQDQLLSYGSLIAQSISSQILPKLLSQDELAFKQLLLDVFDQYDKPNSLKLTEKNMQSKDEETDSKKTTVDQSNKGFEQLVRKSFNELQLIENDLQIQQVLDLKAQLHARLGVALVGPSGSGKTTVWRLLAEALRLQQLKQQHDKQVENHEQQHRLNIQVINPKSLHRSQLLGYTDTRSHEWIDGLLPALLRQAFTSELVQKQRQWLVWDGVIEPNWAEALNSVLDDNHLYTLPTGERMDIDSKRFSFLFETHSLEHASPATISRLGILALHVSCQELFLRAQLQQHHIEWAHLGTLANIENQKFQTSTNVRLALVRLRIAEERKISDKTQLHNEETALTMDKSFFLYERIKRTLEELQACVKMKQPVLLCGERGIGKYTLAMHSRLADDHVISIICNRLLDANTLWNVIAEHCVSIASSGNKQTWKPKRGTRLVLILRRIDLLVSDNWGTKQALQWLAHTLEQQGTYDWSTGIWNELPPILIICTATRVDQIDKKLLSQLAVLEINPLEDEDITSILQTHINASSLRLSSTQINAFCKGYISLLRVSRKNNNYTSMLGNGIQCIERLKCYASITSETIAYELSLAMNWAIKDKNLLQKLLRSLFIKLDLDTQLPFTNIASHAFEMTNIEQLEQIAYNEMDQWRADVEYWQYTLCLPPEWLKLYTYVRYVLTLKTSHVVTHLLAEHGNFRTLAVYIAVHSLACGNVWTPDTQCDAMQLLKKLHKLLEEEEIQAQAQDQPRILTILVDEAQMMCIDHLDCTLYSFLCEERQSPVLIRLFFLSKNLNDWQFRAWSGLSIFYLIDELSEKSIRQISEACLEDEILQELEESNDLNTYKGINQNDEQDKNNKKISEESESSVQRFLNCCVRLRTLHDKTLVKDNRAYMQLLRTFGRIYMRRSEQLRKRLSHLQAGLAQLAAVQEHVQRLQTEADKQRNILESKQSDADDALRAITASMKSSEQQQSELEDVRENTRAEREQLQARKVAIDAQLAQIEPQLRAANSAVGGIRPEQLHEIRSLRVAPDIVRDILEAVLRLLGSLDTSWNAMKAFLGRRGVREELISFDCTRVSVDALTAVQKLLQTRSSSFVEANAKRASQAAAPLAAWVLAVLAYSSVLQQVAPLQAELDALQANLRVAETRVGTLNEQLNDVQTVVKKLQEKLNEATLAAAQVQLQLAGTLNTLEHSAALVNELGEEHERWQVQARDIKLQYERLTFVCLLGAFRLTLVQRQSSRVVREDTVRLAVDQLKLDPQVIEDIDELLNALGGETDGALTACADLQTPLLIDPQRLLLKQYLDASVMSTMSNSERLPTSHRLRRRSVSSSVVRSSSAMSIESVSSVGTTGSSIKILDAHEPDFVRKLELALRFGGTLIIQNGKCEGTTGLLLASLLERHVFGVDGGRQWIMINNRRLELGRQIRVQLLGELQSLGALSGCLCVVDRTPDATDVHDRLLAQIIRAREPTLEEKRINAQQQKTIAINRVHTLEEQLLISLDVGASLLQDETLLSNLRALKATALEAKNTLEQLNVLSSQLEEQRRVFTPLADMCARQYLILRSLYQLHPVYILSLAQYESVLLNELNGLSQTPNLSNVQINQLAIDLFANVAVMLFREHFEVAAQFMFEKLNLNSTTNLQQKASIQKFLYAALKRSETQLSQPILILTRPGIGLGDELAQVCNELHISQLENVAISVDTLESVTTKLLALRNTPQAVLCLVNIHLVLDWLPTLVSMLTPLYTIGKQTNAGQVVLVSECVEQLPASLLETCTKYAYETPVNLSAQLQQLSVNTTLNETSYNLITNANGATVRSDKHAKELQPLYARLAYLHAVCATRVFYTPIGWLREYAFGVHVHSLAIRLLQQVNNSSRALEYTRDLLMDVVYSPHLISECDLRVLRSLINLWFDKRTQVPTRPPSAQRAQMNLLALPLNASSWREAKRLLIHEQQLKLLNSQSTHTIINTHDTLALSSKLKELRLLVEQLQLNKHATIKGDTLIQNAKTPIELFYVNERNYITQLAKLIVDSLRQTEDIQQLQQLAYDEPLDAWTNAWPHGDARSASRFLQEFAAVANGFTFNKSSHSLNKVLNPMGLLSALRQNAARTLSKPMHTITQRFMYLNTNRDELAICLKGIWLSGAKWTGSVLNECEENSAFIYPIQELWITFESKQEKTSDLNSRNMEVDLPLFTNDTRESFLCYVNTPCTTGSKSKWESMSCAYILQFSD